MIRLVWPILFLIGMASCQCRPKNPHDFAIIFTTNLQGYVEPCGCTADPLGGIGRLATIVHDVNSAFDGRTIFVDAGNLLFDTTKSRGPADLCQDEARIDLLLSTLKSLGLAVTVPGPYDNARGELFRDNVLKKHHIPTTSSQIVEKNGIRIWIAQTPLAETKRMLSGRSDIDIVIQGQETGERPLPAIAMSPRGPWIVSASMQGQHLGVLEFHRPDNSRPPFWTFDDRAVQVANRRRILTARLDSLRKREQTEFFRARIREVEDEIKNLSSGEVSRLSGAHFTFRQIPISRDIKSDGKVQKDLDAYEAQIPALVQSCETNLTCPKLEKGQASYVGAETCKGCHQAAYDVWQKAVFTMDAKDKNGKAIKRRTGHAVAWPTLEEAHKTSDRSCVGCHSIGFMEPGGYCKVSDVGFRRGVQCESCHGPGSAHAKSGNKALIKRQVPESTCRSCHHVPHIPTTESFVYEEKLQRILGKGHGEALLMKLKHQ